MRGSFNMRDEEHVITSTLFERLMIGYSLHSLILYNLCVVRVRGICEKVLNMKTLKETILCISQNLEF